jgi:NTE family protein
VVSETQDGERVVVVDVDEKPWGPNYLRIGGRAVSDLHTDARFSITVQHTRTWLNAWGAEWRNEAQVGDVRRFTTSLYQPLGPASPFFVEPALETVTSDSDIFTSGNRRTDRITHSTHSASTVFGMRLGTTGVARLGLGREWYRASPVISTQLEGTFNDRGDFARASVTFDTLDDANFPHLGHLVNANAGATRFAQSGDTVQTFALNALVPYTYGRFTVTGLAAAGYSRDDKGGFALGGLFNLSGTPVGAVTGSQALGLAALAYYRLGDLPRALGRGLYAGVSLEAANAWARRADVRFSDLRKAASIYVGADSIIGPLYFGYGHTFGGDSALYLFLGRPTDHN